MKYSIKKYLILLTVALTGCVMSDIEDGGITPFSGTDGDGMVTITVNIPGTQTPATRSIADNGGEAYVETVDILVFDDSGTLSQHAVGKSINNTGVVDGLYTVQFQAKLDANNDARTVAIIANAHTATASAVATADTQSKSDILDALTFAQSGAWNTNSANTINPVAGTHYMPIPMYGEKAINSSGITAGMKVEGIALTRMVARVDVKNNDTGFTLKKVFVANRQNKGYIAPLSTPPAPPTIPSSSTRGNLEYNYTSGGLAGDIYLFEAPAASGAENATTYTEAVCLVLFGTYKGTDYYYRVDFTTGVEAPTVAYMPVYRNHRYNFTVTAVNGVGSTSLGDALETQFLKNNLKTSLLVVDESRVKNIVFDGEHYLGIESREVFFDWENGDNTTIFCTTNHPSGWEIDANYGEGTGIEYTAGTDGWLTVDIDGNNIELTAPGNTRPEERTAKVHIRAGNLAGVINVTQEEGLLYVGRFGGALKQTGNEWQFEKKLYMQGRDQSSSGLTWGPIDNNTEVRDYWDGKGNTLKLYNRWKSTTNNYPAALACFTKNSDYASIVEDDALNYVWYLPAQRQLQAAWVSSSNNSFGNRYYRSATEDALSFAWSVDFGIGSTYSSAKTASDNWVRCVREVTTP